MQEKNKAMTEIRINILFCCIVVGMFIVSRDYDFVKGTILGARTFPLLVGSLLIVFACANIIGAMGRLKAMHVPTPAAKDPQESLSGSEILQDKDDATQCNRFNAFIRDNRVVCAILLMMIYYLLLVFLGFIIGTVILIPLMLYLLEYRRPINVLLITVVGTMLLFVAFKVLLGVPLPTGLLFG